MDNEPPAWEPPEDLPYTTEAVRSAVRKAMRQPFDPSRHRPDDETLRLTFDDATWTEAAIEPRPWIATGYILRKSVTAVIGAGAAGKSSLMVAWAIALVLGIEFHRLKPRGPCKVLTYNTEDDQDEQRRRFSAALRHAGRTPNEIAGLVLRAGTRKVGTLFGKMEDGTIGALPAMDELRTRLEEFRPDVLILDPLVELHDVDENHNSDMREVMATLRSLAVEFDMAVVVAHHTRKGIVTPGDPEAARGASAVKDLCRVAMTVTVMQPEDAKAFNILESNRHLYFRLDDAKANYSAMRAAEWFERLIYPLDNGDWVATAGPWHPPVDVISIDKRAEIEAALTKGTGDGPYSPKLDKSGRSFRSLCVSVGIVTPDGQRGLLDELLATGGYRVRKFRKPSNHGIVLGIQCPDGSPRSAVWADDETDRAGDE